MSKFKGIDLRDPQKKFWVYGTYHKHLPYTPNPIGGVVQESDYKHLIIRDAFSDWNMPRGLQCLEVIGESVKESTGYTGKNASEIYGDDIVKCNHAIHPIRVIQKWEGTWQMVIPNVNSGKEPIHHIADTLEVIGNTFENPELLEVKNE